MCVDYYVKHSVKSYTAYELRGHGAAAAGWRESREEAESAMQTRAFADRARTFQEVRKTLTEIVRIQRKRFVLSA